MVTRPLRDHPHFTAYVALICVCIFWGTTYLGFRIALDSLSPAVVVCVRNLISGTLILGFCLIRRIPLPRGRDLWYTAAFGVLTIAIGNGSLAVSELWTPTGLASLFVTTSTFWYVGVDRLLPGGERLHGPTILGLLVGFAGVLILLAPSARAGLAEPSLESGGGVVLGFLLLQISGATWALGSLLQRNRKQRTNPFVIAGVQQLAAGLAAGVPALLLPQTAVWDAKAFGATIYLAIFGGIVGYGCYMMALSRLPLAIVSTYTYVNPVVAVALGWFVYKEPFGLREAGAMAVIFLGVWMVRRATANK